MAAKRPAAYRSAKGGVGRLGACPLPNTFAPVAGATLFTAVQVYDPEGEHHGRTVDLLIEDGRITVDPAVLPTALVTVALAGLHVSSGWVDFGAAVYEPGHEERESLSAFLEAAATGGYTHVFAYADTVPSVDSAAAARGVLSFHDASFGVSLQLIGALSRGRQGKQLAEIGELHEAGVRFFGDGLRPVADAKLVQLALAYTQAFEATVVVQPGEVRLEGEGLMHEGEVSTMLGVTGLPAVAESIGLERELALLAYRGGRLHLPQLTLASSLERAAFAKTNYSGLTYGVAVTHLAQDDTALVDYDVNAKLYPPLRSNEDRLALRTAVIDKAADVLVSNHRPADIESKRVEFPYAAFGAATIEQAFSIGATALGDASAALFYLARQNRAFVGLPTESIESGALADLTFFLPDHPFVMPTKALAGMGINVSAAGTPLHGVPVGTFALGRWRESRWPAALGIELSIKNSHDR